MEILPEKFSVIIKEIFHVVKGKYFLTKGKTGPEIYLVFNHLMSDMR